MKSVFTICGLLLTGLLVQANTVDIRSGMVIRASVQFTAKYYHLNAGKGLDNPILIIEGKNITVDFNQAVLQGSNDKNRPDEMYGLAILIRKGSENIVIKNAHIHGYKIGILADSVRNLTIDQSDLSYNWRQHLQSNRLREDISDWMSYHHNENDEWLRYGAAIYLKNCNRATVTNTTVMDGQCALLMTRCDNAIIRDNSFTFNSGIGIGLYRSSNNSIYHNRLDFNVRGFSFGNYQRGQDSAALLLFEQCNNNIIAFNTATHSGDGFFLWAGQSTLDTGMGGCNDNIIYGNDFSFAPTNGVEVTFSRNLVMKNRITDCDYGIWGGYSYESDFTDNTFANNRIGIGIEHGQDNNIALNRFTNDQTGIKLWSGEEQPSDWVYPKKKNTDSRNYWIAANGFTMTPVAFDIMGTDTVVFSGNTRLGVQQHFVLGDRNQNIDSSREEDVLDMDYQPDERIRKLGITERPAEILPSGKKEIRVTEWGPYDFQYPLLWLNHVDSSGLYYFDILGPGGQWTVGDLQGFQIMEKGDGKFPSTITVKADSTVTERSIRLHYQGPGFLDAFGNKQDSSSARDFTYSEFDPHPIWSVSWYRWDAAHDPDNDFTKFSEILNGPAFLSTQTDKLDYTWWGPVEKGFPADSFATVAVAKMQLKKNNYSIGITADDYVKLFIDGRELIHAWDAASTALDENTHHRIQVSLSEGMHEFRIVQAEKTGLATLQFYMQPAEGFRYVPPKVEK
ncbi:MAG: right-handed parallel beta-helix repeat-containing protein [Bacteroidota bacterium]|nr:right-handed parallel beta-helix repeat-containing protein [Bacteroidota bacterium]